MTLLAAKWTGRPCSCACIQYCRAVVTMFSQRCVRGDVHCAPCAYRRLHRAQHYQNLTEAASRCSNPVKLHKSDHPLSDALPLRAPIAGSGLWPQSGKDSNTNSAGTSVTSASRKPTTFDVPTDRSDLRRASHSQIVGSSSSRIVAPVHHGVAPIRKRSQSEQQLVQGGTWHPAQRPVLTRRSFSDRQPDSATNQQQQLCEITHELAPLVRPPRAGAAAQRDCHVVHPQTQRQGSDAAATERACSDQRSTR